MPRVIGIDPGTVSIDVCGLDEGTLFLDRSLPTAQALADPGAFIASFTNAGGIDLIAGPSGYGLPLVRAADATDEDLRLAFLAAPGETGGIAGLHRLATALGQCGVPVVYTPGVIHLDTVPSHRKLNRVDMGTADKVAAAALGIADQAERLGCSPRETSFLLLELGGAFSAALAVHGGCVVDGLGGTSGSIGWGSSGALDGEVAYLAGAITKEMLFRGGVRSVIAEDPSRRPVALAAFVEGAIRAARGLEASVPEPREVLVSGRALEESDVGERLVAALGRIAPVHPLRGFALAKPAAQGAAILADGLSGGRWRDVVDNMRLRAAHGTVLDHLVVISRSAARRRLGLD
ncbi:MAG TPA: DUF1464 family protein [Gemmatimonadales bacterium]|nr:DUF1464 family protein [Gemmatimonadales bacterium]